MSTNFSTKQICALEFKSVDRKAGIVEGYFSSFGTVDSIGDVILKGAFAKTIAEQGPNSRKPRIKHFMNHDITWPLSKLTELREEEKGLAYVGNVGTHIQGRDFIDMVESGLITEHSFGYSVVKSNQLREWKDWKEGVAMREITELKMFEGSSLTAWGVNSNTPMRGIKGIESMAERAKKLDEFCRKSEASDELIQMLLLEHKTLIETIEDLQREIGSTKPHHTESTLPQTESKSAIDLSPIVKALFFN